MSSYGSIRNDTDGSVDSSNDRSASTTANVRSENSPLLFPNAAHPAEWMCGILNDVTEAVFSYFKRTGSEQSEARAASPQVRTPLPRYCDRSAFEWPKGNADESNASESKQQLPTILQLPEYRNNIVQYLDPKSQAQLFSTCSFLAQCSLSTIQALPTRKQQANFLQAKEAQYYALRIRAHMTYKELGTCTDPNELAMNNAWLASRVSHNAIGRYRVAFPFNNAARNDPKYPGATEMRKAVGIFPKVLHLQNAFDWLANVDFSVLFTKENSDLIKAVRTTLNSLVEAFGSSNISTPKFFSYSDELLLQHIRNYLTHSPRLDSGLMVRYLGDQAIPGTQAKNKENSENLKFLLELDSSGAKKMTDKARDSLFLLYIEASTHSAVMDENLRKEMRSQIIAIATQGLTAPDTVKRGLKLLLSAYTKSVEAGIHSGNLPQHLELLEVLVRAATKLPSDTRLGIVADLIRVIDRCKDDFKSAIFDHIRFLLIDSLSPDEANHPHATAVMELLIKQLWRGSIPQPDQQKTILDVLGFLLPHAPPITKKNVGYQWGYVTDHKVLDEGLRERAHAMTDRIRPKTCSDALRAVFPPNRQ